MIRSSCHLVALLAACSIPSPVVAGDFTFDLPELAGTYQGENSQRQVDLELGMPFAQIEGVSLRLVGDHTPGVIQLLSQHAPEEPYPAEVIGWFPEAGSYFTTAFDQILPPVAGPFDVTFNFKNLTGRNGEPNFGPLLDGEARLNFAVAGPPVIAIYSIISLPFISVDSATIIINGQPELDTFMLPGDYDRNGAVDDADFELWQTSWGSTSDLRADGNGDGMVDAADYSVWRAAVGTAQSGAAAISAAVPEPNALVMALITTVVLLRMRHRR